MKLTFTTLVVSLFCSFAFSQKSYSDSIKTYITHYIETHDAVSGNDTKYLRFYAPDKAYRVKAKFTKTNDNKWFKMETSGVIKKTFRVYGTVSFSIHDTAVSLNIYQMQSLMDDDKYKDYLFLPFTDLTTGNESYHTGRYLDFTIKDIKNGELEIDFNKAYNPSCAYVSGKYNCPIPPRENNLPVAIKAGEMNFAKKSH
ncbi:MAG: DUF1684 domain-containing protein [Bacteroidetes bacterium]|nr:DUF1684 domain-containing protein [Bacteroidota bacterium]